MIDGTGQRKSNKYILYWRNVHDNNGFIKYIVELLQLTEFFLEASFIIPTSFTSGIEVFFCVCTLTWIFPAMAPLVFEQVMSLCLCLTAPSEPKMVQQIFL